VQDPYRRYQSWDEVPEKKSREKKKTTVPKRKAKKPLKPKKSQSGFFAGRSFSFLVIVVSTLGVLASGSVLFFPDLNFEKLTKIVIRLPQGLADTETKNGAEKGRGKGIGKELNPSTEMLSSDSAKLSMENTNINAALEKKRLDLEEKERALNLLAENLNEKKAEIDKQLKEMIGLRREISSVLDEKVEANQTSLNKLVSVYSNMKPANAARILTSLDESLAVKVLGKMKKQNAASILNYIDPKKAQVLSEKYAGLKE